MKQRMVIAIVAIALAACPFDATLRAYLNKRFWLPFTKHGANFLKKGVKRTNLPYAGIVPDNSGNGSIAEVQRLYLRISGPQTRTVDYSEIFAAIAKARADKSLNAKQREEVELVDAKTAMRHAHYDAKELGSARAKFEAFLRTARDPAYRSEARGWLARVHYLLGNQTAAGKIYLDELNRSGSNLSPETLLTSLQILYGRDGGPKLRRHLAEYFDTPEHAAFAIQVLTNSRWRGPQSGYLRGAMNATSPPLSSEQLQDNHGASSVYQEIRSLLDKHAELLRRNPDQNGLPMLAIRTALRMGDLTGALRIADAVPSGAALRSEPDYLWSLGAARFLTGDYKGSEKPLVELFQSKNADEGKRAAAAYGLCGVYRKLSRPVEQLQFALWLRGPGQNMYLATGTEDFSIYYAPSGWDLNLLLEYEAPIEALREFIRVNPRVKGIEVVKYSLAIRLARENAYEEAAALLAPLGAPARAARMRRLAALKRAADENVQDHEAKYRLAQFIAANTEGLYFNDRLWGGFQRYAFEGATDVRFTAQERALAIEGERKFKDEQEEYWRAYLLLKEVVRDAGNSPLGRKSATLAVTCLRRLSDRFGREQEIRQADIELSRWLQR